MEQVLEEIMEETLEGPDVSLLAESTTKIKVTEVQMMDVKDPAWRWPTYEKWYSRLEGKWRTKTTTSSAIHKKLDDVNCPFEVTYLINEMDHDAPDATVKLRSPHLIGIIRKCLPVMAETLCCEEPSIDAKDLFVISPALQQELRAFKAGGIDLSGAPQGINATACDGASDNCNSSENGGVLEDLPSVGNGDDGVSTYACLHLHHLLRFLDEHFKDISTKFTWLKQEGLVTYKMLWAFLTPGLEVRRTCNLSGEPCYGVVGSKGKYDHRRWAPDENCFKITLKVMDYNVDSYRKCTMKYKIQEFDGEVPFTSLTICPLSFFSVEERQSTEKHLRQRGELFYSYGMKEPFRFMHFQGSLGHFERNLNGCFQLRRVNADGRVMLDLLSLARVNPDWPLGNAQPPSELLRGFDRKASMQKPSEEDLQWAPAIVFGFSFSLKMWGCFDLGGLREITFDDDAYKQLVMKSVKQKEMLRALVSTRLSERSEKDRAGVDVVSQKGEGCVVLCYGPPGTGKTLTAETLAETLHRPLWAISAFELGEEAGELERQLRQLLSTALRWHAVVLLDEADGYLERRGSNVDIKRNLMTGVFLRLLEYYAGVLFLSTNRVAVFDEAFLSRISLCIRYPGLDDQRRVQIWRVLLARAGLADSTTQDKLNSLVQCGQALNGREIRNIIALAHTWAQSCGQPLGLAHVDDALQLVISGSKELLQDLE